MNKIDKYLEQYQAGNISGKQLIDKMINVAEAKFLDKKSSKPKKTKIEQSKKSDFSQQINKSL